MLCSWARDHAYQLRHRHEPVVHRASESRGRKLGVADKVNSFMAMRGLRLRRKVDVAACVGCTWIAGESRTSCFWRGACVPEGSSSSGSLLAAVTATEDVARVSLPDHLRLSPASRTSASFGRLGYDVVEIVLADQNVGQIRGRQVAHHATRLVANHRRRTCERGSRETDLCTERSRLHA
jgi:hypothetical protein